MRFVTYDSSAYWQDFVESVSTLLTVRQGTVHLRKRIGELDGQMGDVGRALGEKVSSSWPSLIYRNEHYCINERLPRIWMTL